MALAACGDSASSRDGEWEVSGKLDRSRSTVPIRVAYGPACEQFGGVDVEEDAERVKITVRLVIQDPGGGAACSDVGVSEEVDVELDQPLGDRELTGPGFVGSSDLP
ncbi:hypothetical protein ACFVTZ_03970 [Cellulosimicrobium cellulans]|uniref:hypothetical protein n=1 Tax=Cellulosimicrobium cellulans TaxID=1710 RepID=UPI0036EF15FC